MPRSSLAVLGLALAGFGPATAQPKPVPRGHLFIVGGGSQPPPLVDRFVALAGGANRARIAVIPLASGSPRESGDDKAAQLRELGAEVVVWIPSRAEAADPRWAARVDSVTGIWFTGGDQARITEVLAGTPLAAALRSRYRAGAVVGGTSAGAAIMSDSMITGNQTPPGDTTGYYGDEYPAIARRRVEIVPGLGFLPQAIVDQHFIRRERHNRLMSAVLERPRLLGVGIDESTALVVEPDGRWRVLGESSVVIYDARRAKVTTDGRPLLGAVDLRVHVIPSGGVFDPASGGGRL